jgi:DNA-binding NarL/FixJ family response regulator
MMQAQLRAEERIVPISHALPPIPKVLIADRDSMSSDLLAGALARDSRCEATAIQSSKLMATLATGDFDVVVIAADQDVAAGSVFDLACTVGRAYRKIGIVMLLNQHSDEQVINAFRSGVRGVFSRQQPIAEFIQCVEHVRKGFIWAGRQEANVLLEAFKSIPAPNVLSHEGSTGLTVRELQVVKCAARGKTNKSIAAELALSEHTVKNYLFRAFEKLGVSSRVELLFYLTVSGHKFGITKEDELETDLNVN